MRRFPLPAALLATVLSACTPTAALMTYPPTVKPSPGQSDVVTGGIAFSSGGLGSAVTYGPWRVKGAGVHLTSAGDGAWTGTWSGGPIRLQSSQGKLEGPGTRLRIEQRDGILAIQGQLGGRGVDATVSRKRFMARLDPAGCTIDLASAGDGTLTGPIGCPGSPGKGASAATGTLTLQGEAYLVPEVLLPQFVIALLACLP